MGVIQQKLVEYPDIEGLFDSNSIKAFKGRRATYHVDPKWRPRVLGTIFPHQYWISACFMQFDRFLAIADTGLGKTKVGLDAIEYYFEQHGIKHALVLTGRPISTDEWTDQAEAYIAVPAHNIAGSPAQRRSALAHYPTQPITVSDYCTLQTAFTEKRKKGKARFKMAPLEDELNAFGRQFDLVILDEIHRLKNPSSLRFQMVQALVQEIDIRFGLTGTIFDRHPEDAWAQFFLVDGGETFGSYADFLSYFFDQKPSHWNKYVVEHKIKKEKKVEFSRRMRSRFIRITTKECPGIPPVRFLSIALQPPMAFLPHLKQAEQRIADARDKEEQNTEFQFLRQISSGLLRVNNEDMDATLRLSENPKLDWLIDFLDTLPKEEQVVVFYEFRASGDWINEVLTGSKHTVSWLFGGVKDETTILGEWKKRKTRILLTQTQKAAESLNLQQAAYLVQYERPMTYLYEKQSCARVGGRIGGRPAVVYQLSIKGTIERRIIELIHEGRAISTELLEEPDVKGRLFQRER